MKRQRREEKQRKKGETMESEVGQRRKRSGERGRDEEAEKGRGRKERER